MCSSTIYSLHKSSTTDHLIRIYKKKGIKIEKVATINYNLDASYKFHKKKSCDIMVDLLRIKMN